MNRQEIQQLLDMFLDGMTTVEQEQRLAEYFRSARDVPPEWEPFRRMFGWFDDGMRTKTPLSPPSRGKTTLLVPLSRRRKSFAWIGAAAACAAVLLGLHTDPPEPLPTAEVPHRVDIPKPAGPQAVAEDAPVQHKPQPSSHPRQDMPSARNALADAERIYNEQNHDMVDERYEDVRQAVSTQEVRSRGFFTAVDEQGNVQIIQCTNENTNQSNVVEL